MSKADNITTGDLRKFMIETMFETKAGTVSPSVGMTIASLAKEVNSSLANEIKMFQVNSALLREGKSLGELTHLGRAVIADAATHPSDGEKPLALDQKFEDQE